MNADEIQNVHQFILGLNELADSTGVTLEANYSAEILLAGTGLTVHYGDGQYVVGSSRE